MNVNNLTVGNKVYFENEVKPYKVMATSNRYAIVSRKINKKHDHDLLKFEVERGASRNLKEAWEDCKDLPVYSILDFKENVRNHDDRIFGVYDYSLTEDCLLAIKDLESGEICVSKRGAIPININYIKNSSV